MGPRADLRGGIDPLTCPLILLASTLWQRNRARSPAARRGPARRRNGLYRRRADAPARCSIGRAPQGWNTTDDEEIALRRWRGTTEIVAIEALEADHPVFGTFRTRSETGGSYEVEIRDLKGFTNSCGCIDHRVNGLGTCKHVEGVLAALRRRGVKAFRAAAAAGPTRVEIFLDRRGTPRPAIAWPAAGNDLGTRSGAGARLARALPRRRRHARPGSRHHRRPHRRLARGAGRGAAAVARLAPLRTVARAAAADALAHRGTRRLPGRGGARRGRLRRGEAAAVALPARGHAAPRLRRARAARRRDGARQDRAGDRRLRAAGPPQGGFARPHRLPGLAEGRVGGADRPLHRPAGALGVRAARRQRLAQYRDPVVLHHRQLRAGARRRRRHQRRPVRPTSWSSTRRSASRTGRPRRRGG